MKLASAGKEKIDRVKKQMNCINRILADVKSSPSSWSEVQGRRVTVCSPVTETYAVLVEAVQLLGCNVQWCAPTTSQKISATAAAPFGFELDDSVAAAAVEMGIAVFAQHTDRPSGSSPPPPPGATGADTSGSIAVRWECVLRAVRWLEDETNLEEGGPEVLVDASGDALHLLILWDVFRSCVERAVPGGGGDLSSEDVEAIQQSALEFDHVEMPVEVLLLFVKTYNASVERHGLDLAGGLRAVVLIGEEAMGRGVLDERLDQLRRMRSPHWSGRTSLLSRVDLYDARDSILNSKIVDIYGSRYSCQGVMRQYPDTVSDLSGKSVVLLGFGALGKGYARALRSAGAVLTLVEYDPVLALQAAMEGFEVRRIDSDATALADVIVNTMGIPSTVPVTVLLALKDLAVLLDVSGCETSVNTSGLHSLTKDVVQEGPVRRYTLSVPTSSESPGVVEERRLSLIRHRSQPPPALEALRLAPVLLLLQYVCQAHAIKKDIVTVSTPPSSSSYCVLPVPVVVEERAAFAMTRTLGCNITDLSADQAQYIGVAPGGPYKPASYRY
eukprot:gene5161-6575_t